MTRTVSIRSLLAGVAACGLAVAGMTGCPVNDLLAQNSGEGTDGGVDATMEASPDAQEGDASDASSSPYYPLDDRTHWSFFDISTVLPPGSDLSFSGAEFDGRYLYFVPYSSTNVLRYDSSMDFSDKAAWTYYSFLPGIVSVAGPSFGGGAAALLYRGGAYDGSRFVYFAPFNPNTFAIQYDTKQSFTSPTAWSVFDTSLADPGANYWGVICDVRYAYFVANTTTRILAFDSNFSNGTGFGAQADGGVSGAWTAYDLASPDGGLSGSDAEGFWGGVFDGQYIYFAPFSGGVVERHQTIQAVNFAPSWTDFDFVNAFVQPDPPKFWGGAFDGTSVYFIPYQSTPPVLAAYDRTSTNAFSDIAAWSSFDLRLLFSRDGGSPSDISVAPGFVGAAFDGKRLILAPAGDYAVNQGSYPVPVVAYDTTRPLGTASSYASFDPSTISDRALGFEGSAFDGHYVYFVPHGHGVVARFEAKNAKGPLVPASYTGSWW